MTSETPAPTMCAHCGAPIFKNANAVEIAGSLYCDFPARHCYLVSIVDGTGNTNGFWSAIHEMAADNRALRCFQCGRATLTYDVGLGVDGSNIDDRRYLWFCDDASCWAASLELSLKERDARCTLFDALYGPIYCDECGTLCPNRLSDWPDWDLWTESGHFCSADCEAIASNLGNQQGT